MEDLIKKKYKYINLDDNIAEVVQKYPEVTEGFLAYGLHCVGCFANSFDTIWAGVQIHGLGPEEVKDMMKEVNYVVEQSRGKVKSEDIKGKSA